MEAYLKSTEIIDWKNPNVLELAKQLSSEDIIQTAKACFEWVRDEIRHTADYNLPAVTCKASEVLEARTGFCYAKSHLIAALLRANNIPTGLCYQRTLLEENGDAFCLHGLNAVYLAEFGWYRIDPRGNKEGVDTQFSPPAEKLAFVVNNAKGEADLPEIWPEPLPVVLEVLQKYKTSDKVIENLPDILLLK